MRILTVGLNPTLQRTLVVERLLINTVHRADRSRLDVAGKAANVARVLTQVGYSAVHLCHAGGATGDQWRALCRADRIEVVSPRSHAEARTCTTVIDHNTRSSTEFVEPAPAVTEETASSVMREFQGRIAAFDALLICGSMVPGYPRETYRTMLRSAREAGLWVGVDLHGDALRSVSEERPDLVKINAREFGSTFIPALGDRPAEIESEGGSILTESDLRRAYTPVMKRMQSAGTHVVLSQGARPSIVYNPARDELEAIEVDPIEPVNTIGSGDAMTAGVAARLLAGGSISEAVKFGHQLAARNAVLLKPGTVE